MEFGEGLAERIECRDGVAFHLAALDLHHHYISEAMQDRLRTAWPGVDVDLSHAQTESRGRRYIAVAE
jgi:hypothetical protein